MARATKNTEFEFSAKAAYAALAPAFNKHLMPARAIMGRLFTSPPQVLLLEGGLEPERLAMARYWAALQHCEFKTDDDHIEPCGKCHSCLHIGADMHMDVLVYDGRISNTEDEENPGPIRALSKDNAVTMKSRVADTSHSGKKRVVLLNGIEMKRNSAANTLLKVLEEPSPTSIFVLLTPQREQLLPTLVSRSWVLTLPWPNPHHLDLELKPFEDALVSFLQDGRKWWTVMKGTIEHNLAAQIVLLCQKCLLQGLASKSSTSALSNSFSKLNEEQILRLSQILDEAQESLLYNVHAARVLDNLVTKMFILCRNKA